jgi:hypothetical protein
MGFIPIAIFFPSSRHCGERSDKAISLSHLFMQRVQLS